MSNFSFSISALGFHVGVTGKSLLVCVMCISEAFCSSPALFDVTGLPSSQNAYRDSVFVHRLTIYCAARV